MSDLAGDPTASDRCAADKRAAALAAVKEVRHGMTVGLGTGSTTAFAIEALARAQAQGLRITAAATSMASEALAKRLGMRLVAFDNLQSVDIAIDGADELDPQLRAIKGAGGAMLREKIVAAAAARMIVIIDGAKRVERLGRAALPVEVLPFARSFAEGALAEMGGAPKLRMAGNKAYRTDQSNLVFDCAFGAIAHPRSLDAALMAIPGVVGHGLFLGQIDAAYVAQDGLVEKIERPV